MDREFLERVRNIYDLSGRVAIVTGSAGGVGPIVSCSFVAFGAHGVLASRNLDNLKQRERKVQEMGGEAVAVETDITLGRNLPFFLCNRHGGV
jgi:NADP-dependent 3-hydroxy acid dehydrogenase YdfG